MRRRRRRQDGGFEIDDTWVEEVTPPPRRRLLTPLTGALLAVLVLAVGVFAGIQIQKHYGSSSRSGLPSGLGAAFGGGGAPTGATAAGGRTGQGTGAFGESRRFRDR